MRIFEENIRSKGTVETRMTVGDPAASLLDSPAHPVPSNNSSMRKRSVKDRAT